jgi:hypothetical protein
MTQLCSNISWNCDLSLDCTHTAVCLQCVLFDLYTQTDVVIPYYFKDMRMCEPWQICHLPIIIQQLLHRYSRIHQTLCYSVCPTVKPLVRYDIDYIPFGRKCGFIRGYCQTLLCVACTRTKICIIDLGRHMSVDAPADVRGLKVAAQGGDQQLASLTSQPAGDGDQQQGDANATPPVRTSSRQGKGTIGDWASPIKMAPNK